MEFLTVVFLHFFAVASPGPDFILVTRQSVSRGRRAAVLTSLGIAFGIIFHSLAAITGLTFIVASQPFVFLCLKVSASLYLFYLGFMSIVQTTTKVNSSKNQDSKELNSFFIGLITNVLNPKAIIFFITLFSIVLESTTPVILLIVYGLYMSLATFLWFVAISYIFTNTNLTNRYLHLLPSFEKIIGVILIIIAVQILIYEIPNLYG